MNKMIPFQKKLIYIASNLIKYLVFCYKVLGYDRGKLFLSFVYLSLRLFKKQVLSDMV